VFRVHFLAGAAPPASALPGRPNSTVAPKMPPASTRNACPLVEVWANALAAPSREDGSIKRPYRPQVERSSATQATRSTSLALAPTPEAPRAPGRRRPRCPSSFPPGTSRMARGNPRRRQAACRSRRRQSECHALYTGALVAEISGPSRARTDGLSDAIRTLSQLSYGPWG
jgi:hypothetical protein